MWNYRITACTAVTVTQSYLNPCGRSKLYSLTDMSWLINRVGLCSLNTYYWPHTHTHTHTHTPWHMMSTYTTQGTQNGNGIVLRYGELHWLAEMPNARLNCLAGKIICRHFHAGKVCLRAVHLLFVGFHVGKVRLKATHLPLRRKTSSSARPVHRSRLPEQI